MFRITGDQPSWESRLPVEVLRLPADPARADALLDDPVFFAPFAPVLRPGYRPATDAVECDLRCRRHCRLADQVADLRLELRGIFSPVAVDFPARALEPVPACRAPGQDRPVRRAKPVIQIGRASCRERV